jgi:tRNA uridine 5-carbamoylmethylation protein Kti12
MTHPVIHINGYPGSGKLTIARKLVDLLSPYNGKLVHNHLLIDPVGAVLPRSSPDYQPMRRALRSVIFDALAVSQDTAGSVFVFTDFQSGDDVGRGVMLEYREMAARRNCTFVPITVTCSKDENLRRLASAERMLHRKLTDAELVTHLRDNAITHQWPKDDPFHMELDITALDADVVAHMILEHVLRVCKELGSK